MNNKKNKGITLIMLILIIVIMLMLISVSVDVAIDGKLFDSAKNAVQKTNNKVEEVQSEVNNLMDEWEALNGNQPPIEPPNAPPVITEQATYKEKTTDSITVTATATDENNDNLTYTLYISTSETGEFTANGTSENNASGTQATITATGLDQYTDYYYYVTVNDGKTTATGSTSSAIKTYCPGTGLECTTLSCDGTQKKTCPTCNGSKNVTKTCPGILTVDCVVCLGTKYCKGTWNYVRQDNGNWFCEQCKTLSFYVEYYTCSYCGVEGFKQICKNCSYRWDQCGSHECTACNATGKVTKQCDHGSGVPHDFPAPCDNCSGSGFISEKPCLHESNTPHRYCDHYINTEVLSHQYCSHSKTEKHDD